MQKPKLKVAITEDEAFISLNIKKQLEKMDYEVTGIFTSGESLLDHLKVEMPDVILMDIYLEGGIDGIEASELVHEKYEIPVVFITAFSDLETFERVKANNPYGYLTKPLNFYKMSSAIELAYSKHKMDMDVKHSEIKYRNLFSKMFNGICIFELNVEVDEYIASEYNLSLLSALGIDHDNVKDKSLAEIFPESFPYLRAVFREAVNTGESQSVEKYFPEMDKHLFINVFISLKNQIAFLIEDITEKKKYQDSLYLASLGRISTAITHEINQPLQSIKVMADSIVYMHENGDRLDYDELVSDFKDVSDRVMKIEKVINNTRSMQGQLNTNDLKKIDINISIMSAIANYSKKIESLGIELELNLENKLSKIVASDSILEQVFSNLMNNSVTALTVTSSNDRKKVMIETSETEDFVHLRFSDNGPGIKEEYLHSIFNPHMTSGNSEENMGMGLYIVRCLLNQLNGNITYHHGEPSGAVFLLRFPNKR